MTVGLMVSESEFFTSHDSLEYLIDILEPHIPPVLVSEKGWKQIRDISSKLPLLSFGCFECYLDKKNPRVDFNVCVNAKINEHQLVEDWLKKNSAPVSWEKTRVMIPFFQQWGSKQHPFDFFIHDLWFVFDMNNGDSKETPPWHYFGFTYHQLAFDNLLKAEMINRLLPELNPSLPDNFIQSSKKFIESIPNEILVTAFGLQFHREVAGVRMYLALQSFAEIFSFLREHDWPGDITDLHEKIDPLGKGISFCGLTFDLNPEMQPAIGIEFWRMKNDSPVKMRTITDHFVSCGLCTTEQQEAFLSWEGEMILNNRPNRWRWANQSKNNQLRIPDEVTVKRMSRYFKIIYQTGKPLVTKAYLYFDRPGRII